MDIKEAVTYIDNHENRDEIINECMSILPELIISDDEEQFLTAFLDDYIENIVAEITDEHPDEDRSDELKSHIEALEDMILHFKTEINRYIIDEYGSIKEFSDEYEYNIERDWHALCEFAGDNSEIVKPYLLNNYLDFLYIYSTNEHLYAEEAVQSILDRNKNLVYINILKFITPMIIQNATDTEIKKYIGIAYDAETEKINRVFCEQNDIESVESEYFEENIEQFKELVEHIMFNHSVLLCTVILKKNSKLFTDYIDNF